MKHNYSIFLSLLFSFVLSFTSYAAQTSCPDHFLNGQAPDLINDKLAVKSKESATQDLH